MVKKKPDYRDLDWTELKRDRDSKWTKMIADFALEGIVSQSLWPEGAPGFNIEFDQREPGIFTLPIHKDSKRGMVIICAGGGFVFKSSNEAKPVAEYFYRAGLNAAVLDYRVKPYTEPDACADGLRAIRFFRKNALSLGIKEDKIAIGGFSAGGLLSGMAATCFDYGNKNNTDPVEQVSSRPDAVLLLYGAITFAQQMSEGIGYDIQTQNEIARRSNEKNLRYDCPPFFIFQTHKDDPRYAMNFGKELADRGIPFEVHTFMDGPHGGALYDGKDPDSPLFTHTAKWADLASDWLCELGF